MEGGMVEVEVTAYWMPLKRHLFLLSAPYAAVAGIQILILILILIVVEILIEISIPHPKSPQIRVRVSVRVILEI